MNEQHQAPVPPPPEGAEPQAVVHRYARREAGAYAGLYSPLRPEVWQGLQERQRVMLRGFAALGCTSLAPLRITEVGSGSGGNLLELLRLGASPGQLTGLELLPERHAAARLALPQATTLWLGDALQAPGTLLSPQSQDVMLQSTVFSSLLDDTYQQRLADAMWAWLKPGGAVLWYDLTVSNPRNPDVRGVPLRRVRQLFPQGRITAHRVTLAPPLARVVCRWHPAFYTLFNSLPLLRTHVLAWVHKP
jgi:SAM-dependent methyltransferase